VGAFIGTFFVIFEPVSPAFEILEHTADIGFRAFGDSLPHLFEHAAYAMISIASEIDEVQPRETYPLQASGSDLESLLVAC